VVAHVVAVGVAAAGLGLYRIDETGGGPARLRLLMVLLIVTTAFALIRLSTRGRMLIVIAAAVPVAVLANVVRVTAIGAAVAMVGPEAATGIYHDAIGRAVWVLAMAAILGFGVVLGWSERATGATLLGAHPALK